MRASACPGSAWAGHGARHPAPLCVPPRWWARATAVSSRWGWEAWGVDGGACIDVSFTGWKTPTHAVGPQQARTPITGDLRFRVRCGILWVFHGTTGIGVFVVVVSPTLGPHRGLRFFGPSNNLFCVITGAGHGVPRPCC